jgi:hypothetical protein
MGVKFLHPRTAAAPASGQDEPGTYVIDWRAVRQSDRACCCPARPVVIAVMPPGASRPHQTELLLCRHHYRASRQALRAAGATVLDIKGAPISGGTRAPVRTGM